MKVKNMLPITINVAIQYHLDDEDYACHIVYNLTGPYGTSSGSCQGQNRLDDKIREFADNQTKYYIRRRDE